MHLGLHRPKGYIPKIPDVYLKTTVTTKMASQQEKCKGVTMKVFQKFGGDWTRSNKDFAENLNFCGQF